MNLLTTKREAAVQRVIECLILSLAFVCLLGTSYALASCPDTTYACKLQVSGQDLGTVTLPNSGDLQLGTCAPSGGYAQPAKTCNLYVNGCNERCIACFNFQGYVGGKFVNETRCYDKNGNRQQ